MSMSILSALQCFCAFMAYLIMSVVVPSVAFGKRFKKLDVVKRFMLYFTIGNFFMMNLVFVLALLHITCRFTLIACTLVLVVLCWAKNNNISIVTNIKQLSGTFNSVITGRLGIKTVIFRFGSWLLGKVALVGKKFKEVFIYNIIDWILIGGFTFAFLKIFGVNLVTNYGYAYSDLPVHNYWINSLADNHIFVAGIYPFGFHCIIYYIHEVFLIDTYVLLRVFCVVQTFFVNIMIFTVLKSCCKTKFAPYIGMFGYMALNVFAANTYQRFVGTLPQEFGMIFIYPCAYFAFEFFRERKKELELEKFIYGNAKERRAKRKQERIDRKNAKKDKEKIKKKYFRLRVMECRSTLYLVGFAMSFAMTLAIHFYGTMIAGLFAVGIAVGYFYRFIRPKYFIRVVATCAISVFVAVLPMVIAFAMGTPLQGSLGWGMSILTGGNSDNDESQLQDSTFAYVSTDSAAYVSGAAGYDTTVSGAAGYDTTVSGAAGYDTTVSGAAGYDTTVSGTAGVDATISGAGGAGATDGGAGSIEDGAGATNGSAGSIASGAGTMINSASMIVSGDTVYYLKEMPMKVYFTRIGFVPMKAIHTNGVLNLIEEGNHYFYNNDELKYKRPVSFYLRLLKSNPKKFADRVGLVVEKCSKQIVDQTLDKVFVDATRKQVETGYIIALVLMLAGVVYIILRHPDYGSAIVSVTVFMICMSLLLTAGRLGLPTLMDSIRASIYYAYMVALVLALVADVCIYTVFGWLKWKWVSWIKHFVSFALLAVFVFAAYKYDFVKGPVTVDALESNEAVTCLTNIINEEKDFTWTICSANDETRMGEDHGYHYETIEFLRKMEGVGGNAMITMPTNTVYFFIEKKPLDYTVPYNGSGQMISEKGAANYLPSGSGLSVYKSENRWIVMSRMYYWAQEFSRLYPNEMKVYMETDNFVCYRIEQNTYRLYNFAIDYGYNTRLYKYLDADTQE